LAFSDVPFSALGIVFALTVLTNMMLRQRI